MVWRVALLIFLLGKASLLFAKAIEGVRVWPSPEGERIVFDLSDQIKYKLFALDNPSRVVIDIQEGELKARLPSPSAQTSILRFRHGPQPGNVLRIVLDLSTPMKPTSFLLAPNQTYGHRLVLDLKAKVKKNKVARQVVSVPKKRKWIVAIDPGHGGEDSGAIGRHRRLHEKEVVLAVSKKLKTLINAQEGMEAFLIRTGDYYVSLRKRTLLARERGADLFISVHADSFHHESAKGASVYVLSEKGASNEAARWLAERENRADLIGGVSLEDKGNVLASVLLDLSQTASREASHELAGHLIQHLGKITDLHHRGVQRAGFMVLKSPDIPSVLVELGFISNKEGEAKLHDAIHQHALANALLGGIKAYATKRVLPLPVRDTLLAEKAS